jgi:hypothetical protein
MSSSETSSRTISELPSSPDFEQPFALTREQMRGMMAYYDENEPTKDEDSLLVMEEETRYEKESIKESEEEEESVEEEESEEKSDSDDPDWDPKEDCAASKKKYLAKKKK